MVVERPLKQQARATIAALDEMTRLVATTAERRNLPVFITASGRAEAKASVAVKSRLYGQVAAILFTEGSPVHKGQVLLRVDPEPADAQLRQAKAPLARDEAQLERLVRESRRNTALYEQGFISKSGLSQTQADLHGAQVYAAAMACHDSLCSDSK